MAAIDESLQSLEPGSLVTLYVLDATDLGGDLLRFTAGPLDGAPVEFDGDTYAPIPIEAEGFEWSGQGALPTPTLRVSNVGSAFVTLILGFNDLLGATVLRLRTFERFLDDGADPDPGAVFNAEMYRIERKVKMTGSEIEFELASSLDHEGVMLPRRVALRDSCTHRYRRFTGSAFDYTKASCPYTTDADGAYFDETGSPTIRANDRCGKRLSDCRLRFGQNGRLPTRSFPGMAQVR